MVEKLVPSEFKPCSAGLGLTVSPELETDKRGLCPSSGVEPVSELFSELGRQPGPMLDLGKRLGLQLELVNGLGPDKRAGLGPEIRPGLGLEPRKKLDPGLEPDRRPGPGPVPPRKTGTGGVVGTGRGPLVPT